MRSFVKYFLILIMVLSIAYLGKTYVEANRNPATSSKVSDENKFKSLMGISQLSTNFDLKGLVLVNKTPLYRKGGQWASSFNEGNIEGFSLEYKYTDINQALQILEASKLLIESINVDSKTDTIQIKVRVKGTE